MKTNSFEPAPSQPAERRKMSYQRVALLGFLSSLLIGGFVLLAHALAVSHYGILWLVQLSVLAVLPLAVLALSLPVALVAALGRRVRGTALRIALFSLVYLVIGVPFMRISFNVRRSGFEGLAKRSVVLVNAVREYEKKYGRPPESLQVLVPEFLDSVPHTGMRAYPEYQYIVVNQSELYEGNPWVISVPASVGVMNWDQFLYFPKQNYPAVGNGGVTERIGDWAYVHE